MSESTSLVELPSSGNARRGHYLSDAGAASAGATPVPPNGASNLGRSCLYSWRAGIVALCALAVLISYADRSNLSVAIIAISRERNWSQGQSGDMLGAFFYGYMATQIVGGYLSHRVGGKQVLAWGMAACSAATVLHEAAAALGLPAFFAARVLVGLAEGVTYPAVHSMLAEWIPAGESARAVAVVTNFAYVGTIFASAVAPPLLEARGWPAVFYFFGGLGFAWLPLWLWLASDRPEEHRYVLAEELAHIRLTRHAARPVAPRLAGDGTLLHSDVESEAPLIGSSAAGRVPVPWLRILSRREVWAIMAAYFFNSWGFFVLLSWLPEFFYEKFGTKIADLPLFVVAPWVAQVGAGLGAGVAADHLVKRGWSVITVRRSFQATAMLGAAFFLLLAAYAAQSAAAGAALVAAALGVNSLTTAGHLVNHLDVAPRHAGIVFGIGNTAGILSAIVSVPLTGALLSAGAGWTTVFGVGAGCYVLGAALYLALAGADPAPLGPEGDGRAAPHPHVPDGHPD